MTTAKKETRSKKISRLWCLARDCGMDSDMLHVAVEGITGKESIKALTIGQLDACIDSLLAQRGRQRGRQYRKNQQGSTRGVSYLPTPEQRSLVTQIMENLTEKLALDNPAGYLESICRRTFRREYSRLTRSQMKNLIEALKSIQNRGA